ncbi:VOC family protein [Streptomyces viridosporus]|uniref:VOC family protein n=1 Tax=Streptomyces viridosporus TaxID=67581 RepID=UPI001AD82968|nr:VOC family protein [Streptomyces viridosporus]
MNGHSRNLLAQGRVATRLPARDLERARRFYSEKLGLQPVEEAPGGLMYRCGGAEFQVFQSAGASPGTFTQMSWEVHDIEAVVGELKQRGVVFEEFALSPVHGGARTRDGIVDVQNYLSTRAPGPREARGAWFRDSEGNMLGIGQPVT